jgi:hypothetical protein
MAHTGRSRIVLLGVYVLLGAASAWYAVRVLGHLRTPRPVAYDRYHTVGVGGNVERPGRYRVAEGTTFMEILKVAGVRLTSDFSALDLARQVTVDQDMEIGTLPQPVALREPQVSARLEFFFGDLTIISRDGSTRPQQEGLTIEEGDLVQTDVRSQAELSVGTYSRVDIDGFSEIAFDRIAAPQQDTRLTEISHRSGVCWYKVTYGTTDEQFRILTDVASITVAGSGADFLVEMTSDATVVHTMDGLLLVERVVGEEAANVISGQTVSVFNDGRPFQVTRLASEVSANERFSSLVEDRTGSMMRSMPLNVLICGAPQAYYFISTQFEKGEVHAVQLPGNTLVEEFAQGFSTLNEALLYGGIVFVTTLVEQIMSIRISNYGYFAKDDVARAIAAVGGITVNVDNGTASYLGMSSGLRKLNGSQATKYMSPAISGETDSRRRQIVVLRALFDGVYDRNIVLTALLADQILSNVETNFTPSEIMSQYVKFTSRRNWTFKSHDLPTRGVSRGNKVLYQPDLDKARSMLFEQG